MDEIQKEHYVYIYLDNRKPGKWYYKDLEFDFQPFYVGKGKGRRMKEHLCPSRRSDCSIKNNIINKIIDTCQEKPIHYKIYENLSPEDADDIETEVVNFFGRIDLGTGILANMTDGGKGKVPTRFVAPTEKRNEAEPIFRPQSKRVDQYSIDGNFIQKFDSVNLAARSLAKTDLNKISSFAASIANCCKGEAKSCAGFVWKFDGTSPYSPKPKITYFTKEIFQYSLDGEFLQKFNSHKEALSFIGVVNGGSGLTFNLAGKFLTAHGFRWFGSFQGETVPPLPPQRVNRKKPINSFDGKGNVIKRYSSITAAREELGKVNIFRALSDPSQRAAGFYWEYA